MHDTTVDEVSATAAATATSSSVDNKTSVSLKLCLYGAKLVNIEKNFDKTTTIEELDKELRKLFNVDDENRESKIWINNSKENPPEQTLNEANVSDSAVVTLELKNVDGSWPSSKPSYDVGKLPMLQQGEGNSKYGNEEPGLCGLRNLGNTCFMNSALQCLANTPPIVNYILNDKFLEDLNTTNPLGMQGQLAKSFAELIKAIWKGQNNLFTPRDIKYVISRFAPQFNGFAQHDCQEIMAFLLDGLHEDLNRIKDKPYIEIKNDIESRPDETLAEESWSNYKKRNDSIVVDTFHAMLKSTLVCPGCELVSVTFDPFCYLSLPLPERPKRQVNVTFLSAQSFGPKRNNPKLKQLSEFLSPEEVENFYQYGASISSLDGLYEQQAGYEQSHTRPTKWYGWLPRMGSIKELCDCVADWVNKRKSISRDSSKIIEKVNPNNLIVAETSTVNNRFNSGMTTMISKIYEPTDNYADLGASILVIEKSSNYVVPLYLRRRKSEFPSGAKVVGKPLFLHVPDLKFSTLYKSIITSISNITCPMHKSYREFIKDNYANGAALVNFYEDTWFKLVDPIGTTATRVNRYPLKERLPGEKIPLDKENEEYTRPEIPADVCDGDDILTNFGHEQMEVENGELKKETNGDSVEEDDIEEPVNGNAFDLCTVNSFGSNSIDTLVGIDTKELEYSTKLYLGASFNANVMLSPQFRHIFTFSDEKYIRINHRIKDEYPGHPEPSTIQLEDCITQFANVERLGADDPWYCPKCKKHQQATKKFDIWSLPNILIIHLKRFLFSRSWRDKIDTLVEFPLENLDMSKYVLNPSQKAKTPKYNLIAVANHFGGLSGGHYTAFARNERLGSWYSLDDSHVIEIASDKVVTKYAYVLFYQLQDQDQVAGQQ